MLTYIKKFLLIVSFLSTNPTYQKYKKLFLEWLTKKIQAKETVQPIEQTEEPKMGVYPEKLPVESVVFVMGGLKNGTLDDTLPDSVYHALQILQYVVKITVGEPSFVVATAEGAPDLEALQELLALEDYQPRFGADNSGMDPATLLMIIQAIVSLLKSLGIFKRSKTSEVLD